MVTEKEEDINKKICIILDSNKRFEGHILGKNMQV